VLGPEQQQLYAVQHRQDLLSSGGFFSQCIVPPCLLEPGAGPQPNRNLIFLIRLQSVSAVVNQCVAASFHDYNRSINMIALSLIAGLESQISSVALHLTTPVRVGQREVRDTLTSNAGNVWNIHLLSIPSTSQVTWFQWSTGWRSLPVRIEVNPD
jgi:hypothetical protein